MIIVTIVSLKTDLIINLTNWGVVPAQYLCNNTQNILINDVNNDVSDWNMQMRISSLSLIQPELVCNLYDYI